ncbi:hypothetical protein DYB26_014476, partial [Aphanomyces astaci]
MFAKSTGELIKQSVKGDNQFDKFLTYVIIVALVLAISLQTHCLSLGLKYFDALYIVPVFQCFFITFSVIGGAVYFEEFKDFTMTQWIVFPIGVLITIAGVVVLSSRDMEHDAGAPASFTDSSMVDIHLPPVRNELHRCNSGSFTSSFRVLEPEFCPAANPAQLLSRSSSVGGVFYSTQSVVMSSRGNSTDFSAMQDTEMADISRPASVGQVASVDMDPTAECDAPVVAVDPTVTQAQQAVGHGIGLNIQKYSFMLQQHLPDHERKPYNTQWRWWLGFFGVGLGSIADFAALSFAAQSIIMPIGAFTLVCNIFFAHYWLKEKLTRNDLIGTVLICIGAVVVTIYGSHENVEYTLEILIHLYYRWDMLIYLVVIIAVVWVLIGMLKRAELVLKKKGPASLEYKAVLKLHPLTYAGLAGVFGAQSVMFAKSSGELLKQTLRGDNQFDKFLTYVIIVALVITISLETHCLSLGLKYFDALYIVPVFQCFFITFSVIGGAVYFEEFKYFTMTQWIVFPIGVLITIAGVIVLSSRDMAHD